MISVFDTTELQNVLKDFYEITHVRITVFDEQFHELVSYPESLPEFCKIIRSCEAGRKECLRCDQNACHIASKRQNAYIYRCHAGLTEAIMPLCVDDILVGYLIFGHIFSYENFEEGWNEVLSCCEKYPIDLDKLKEACKNRPQLSETYIKAASRVLHATASYLVLEHIASLKEDTTAIRLNDYLNSNYTKNLTTETICKDLSLGRTRLFKLSNQIYGIGPAEQIKRLRIEKAKELLIKEQHLTISEIAQVCGFEDYNYFISVFKKATGQSPGKFRKSV